MKKYEEEAQAALQAVRQSVNLYGIETLRLGAQTPDVESWFQDPNLVKLPMPIRVRKFEPVLFTWSNQIPQGESIRHETVIFTITQVLQPYSMPVRGTYGEIKVSTARIITPEELQSAIRQDEKFASWICASVSQLFWRIRQARYPSQISFGKTSHRTSAEYIRELVPHPR